MKTFKLALHAVILTFAAFSLNAFAEDCTWGGIGLKPTNGNYNLSVFCKKGSTTVATKTTYIPIKGATKCSINVNGAYTNKGTCLSPNITAKPKVCPIIDIGMTCDWSGSCNEAFGRTCASRGGKTVNEGGMMVCRASSC